MMRETQKDGPKDLRPISLEELKKHSHQAGPGRMPHLARDDEKNERTRGVYERKHWRNYEKNR